MNSCLYVGKLNHTRMQPVKHAFQYPIYFFAINLDELPHLDQRIPFFSYNRFNVFSIHDKDYLNREAGPIKEKLLSYLAEKKLSKKIQHVMMVTCAKFFGYIFNPATFFYCFDDNKNLVCTVTQVNNTFDETHLYILTDPTQITDKNQVWYQAPKEFHVSPFFDRIGHYEFKFSPIQDDIDIHVDLWNEQSPLLLANICGKRRKLTQSNLWKTLLRFPLDAVLTLPRIHWQATKLYFQKKLKIFKKPVPESTMTIRKANAAWYQRITQHFVLKFLSKIDKGTLTLYFPDETKKIFKGSQEGHQATINIHHYNFFTRLAKDAGIGLGESYMEDEWRTPDLTAVLQLLIDNKPCFDKKISSLEKVGAFFNRLFHLKRKNTLQGSKKNIHEHYDLGNSFFKLFLDSSMTYSCGIYESESDTLEIAQKRKIHSIIRKARLKASDHLLEIGCGWGAFAIEAVKQTGCRVTGITVSEEQRNYALQRIQEEGFEDRIDIQLCDYRHMEGQYDRIVSIEMLEAVGHEYFKDYFQSCERLLKPDGIAVIQVITIPDQRYESYRRGTDFIQKHIFPGGHLPCLNALSESITTHTDFFIENLENIGVHYATTLRQWFETFRSKEDEIATLGFPKHIIRAWEYYFCYCEAGFANRYLNDLHLVLTRPANANLNRSSDLKETPEYV